MYADDMCSPTQKNEYDNVNLGVIKKTIKKLEDIDNARRNYYTITRPFNNMLNGKFCRTVNISYFGSGVSGSKIRNAVDGMYTDFVVGRKKDESNFFKVTMSCGIHANGPVTLYYNSPEEYEKHQFVELDKATKERWVSRRNNV